MKQFLDSLCFAVLQIKDGYVKMLTWFFSKLNVNTDGWK